MKKQGQKRLIIVAADGFAAAEIETLQHLLEDVLGGPGRETPFAVRRLRRTERRPGSGKAEGIEIETTWKDAEEDAFEEAPECVEALQPRRRMAHGSPAHFLPMAWLAPEQASRLNE
jgi:hypothetical protein